MEPQKWRPQKRRDYMKFPTLNCFSCMQFCIAVLFSPFFSLKRIKCVLLQAGRAEPSPTAHRDQPGNTPVTGRRMYSMNVCNKIHELQMLTHPSTAWNLPPSWLIRQSLYLPHRDKIDNKYTYYLRFCFQILQYLLVSHLRFCFQSLVS